MAKNELKYGAILSYALIFINSIYGFFMAPFILKTMGISEYGVYKTIGAISSSVGVLQLGIGSTIQRYIAKFIAQGKKDEGYNFSAMGMIQAGVLSILIILVGAVLFFSLDSIYKTFTTAELMRAKQIFSILIITLALHLFEDILYGVITGYNKFTFINTIKICTIALRIVLIFVILPIFKNSMVIVLISLVIEIIMISVNFTYIKKVLNHKFKLKKWDNDLFKESFGYTILLFIQSLILQLNGNLDNVFIGALMGTSAVTVYSFALQIFNMYENCATAVSGVALPTITNKIYAGATPSDLEKTIVKFGRVQWLFLGAALFGFLAMGKEFFELWLGNGYADCWYLTLILMIPVTFPLVVNVCLTILKVHNLLKFRTVAMAYSVVINAIITFFGMKYWGYWAAAIGTAASTVIGSIISLNIYYWKKLKINVFKLYINVFKRITLCLVVPTLIVMVLNKFTGVSWIGFFVKAGVFVVAYFLLLMLFGLSQSEKNLFFKIRGDRN